MFKILVDTCVWLDLAKDQVQDKILDVVEELIRINELLLIVPQIILDEFNRNKARIIKENKQSLSVILKGAKEIVAKFGDPQKKQGVIDKLNDFDFKIPSINDLVVDSVNRIEKLLKRSVIIQPTNEVKLCAAQRALDKKAPFHRGRNNFNDAVILETYAEYVRSNNSVGDRFVFVTHNKKDFSIVNGNEKIPHNDIASYFSKIKSQYSINLAETVRRIRPELITDMMIELEWNQEPRSLTEIQDAIGELIDKVWYNRHKYLLYQIEIGEVKLVDKVRNGKYNEHEIQRDIFEGARKSAKKVEKKYGLKNLGPWDDFEWGMLNGKLSALRWVLGEEWDELYT
jgi:hypothetical protein